MEGNAAAMTKDLPDLARKVRDEVIGPDACFVISPEHPLPTVRRQSSQEKLRYELFHFVFSVCSQKVRATLAEKLVTYGSNETSILPPKNDNYSPQYVRLRLTSDAAKKYAPVSSFTGQTSTESEGFDPLVVPTLVDHETGRVLADSKAICLHLCKTLKTGTELLPADLEEAIGAQLTIVDVTPHVALLYGADPDGDRRPASMRAVMPGVHKKKIALIEQNMALAADEPQLLQAYIQKIAKEQLASSFVIDAAQMKSSIDRAQDIIINLDNDLKNSGGDWIFGDRFTLADTFWAVSLYRLLWLGYAGLWTADRHLPRVENYANRLFARPSVKNTIILWPGHPPSDTVTHLLKA